MGLYVLNWPNRVKLIENIFVTHYHHHQSGSINFFHGCHIFCPYAHEVVVPSYAVGFIFIPGKLNHCVILWWCAQIIENIMARRSFSIYAYYTTSIASLRRRLWNYWTSEMLVGYILSSLCLWLSQFSQLSFVHYMGLCVCSVPISHDCENMCTWSYVCAGCLSMSVQYKTNWHVVDWAMGNKLRLN